MTEKTILILADGMRRDAPDACGSVFAKKFKEISVYRRERTVMPSVTLPCHMSLFHSVDPTRHGVLTNVYTPPVHPVTGLFELLKSKEKNCTYYYSFELLRDIGVTGALALSVFNDFYVYEHVDRKLTAQCIANTKEDKPDFVFLYLGEPDETGHKYGYMGKEYLESVRDAWDNIKCVFDAFKDEYNIIVTADHGGHDRIHGHDIPEDMEIASYMYGEVFKNCVDREISIIDLAPTIAKVYGIKAPHEWDGESLI